MVTVEGPEMTECRYSFGGKRFGQLEVKMSPMATGRLDVPSHLEASSNPSRLVLERRSSLNNHSDLWGAHWLLSFKIGGKRLPCTVSDVKFWLDRDASMMILGKSKDCLWSKYLRQLSVGSKATTCPELELRYRCCGQDPSDPFLSDSLEVFLLVLSTATSNSHRKAYNIILVLPTLIGISLVLLIDHSDLGNSIPFLSV